MVCGVSPRSKRALNLICQYSIKEPHLPKQPPPAGSHDDKSPNLVAPSENLSNTPKWTISHTKGPVGTLKRWIRAADCHWRAVVGANVRGEAVNRPMSAICLQSLDQWEASLANVEFAEWDAESLGLIKALEININNIFQANLFTQKKSRNSDTPSPVELYDRNRVTRVAGVNRMTRVRYLLSYLEWVSHQDFKNIAYVGFFRHFLCVFVFVVVFVIVFVFVFVSSYDFGIAFIISFQKMYGYWGLWSLRAEILTIFEVMTGTVSPIPLIDLAHWVGWAEEKKYSSEHLGGEGLRVRAGPFCKKF